MSHIIMSCLRFLFMFPGLYFSSLLFLERNSATIRNIKTVFGRIIEQFNVERHMQE